MKLYYAPGACSLADHIALHEAGLAFEHERVDLRTKATEHGHDYRQVSAKGYVPALVLDDGQVLTENLAVLDWIAEQSRTLKPHGPLGRTRQLELLAFISAELHTQFERLFSHPPDEERATVSGRITARFELIADAMRHDYLLGDQPGVADFYLFVMLLWAEKKGVTAPDRLIALRERLRGRDSVVAAMRHEGLI